MWINANLAIPHLLLPCLEDLPAQAVELPQPIPQLGREVYGIDVSPSQPWAGLFARQDFATLLEASRLTTAAIST